MRRTSFHFHHDELTICQLCGHLCTQAKFLWTNISLDFDIMSYALMNATEKNPSYFNWKVRNYVSTCWLYTLLNTAVDFISLSWVWSKLKSPERSVMAAVDSNSRRERCDPSESRVLWMGVVRGWELKLGVTSNKNTQFANKFCPGSS